MDWRLTEFPVKSSDIRRWLQGTPQNCGADRTFRRAGIPIGEGGFRKVISALI
jgi:hypothetical protein